MTATEIDAMVDQEAVIIWMRQLMARYKALCDDVGKLERDIEVCNCSRCQEYAMLQEKLDSMGLGFTDAK